MIFKRVMRRLKLYYPRGDKNIPGRTILVIIQRKFSPSTSPLVSLLQNLPNAACTIIYIISYLLIRQRIR